MGIAVERSVGDGLGFAQSESHQCHAGEAKAKCLESLTARDRLGHAFGEFIELVVHVFPFAFEAASQGSSSSCFDSALAVTPYNRKKRETLLPRHAKGLEPRNCLKRRMRVIPSGFTDRVRPSRT